MAENSKISWTDHTFNPWIGCAKVSEGCKNCYAEGFAERRIAKGLWGVDGKRHVTTSTWKEPAKWNRQAQAQGVRRRVFCASLADVFEDRSDLVEPRLRLWDVIRATPNLDWLLLTKRPENIRRMLPMDWAEGYANVWLGASVENQERYMQRVPVLVQIPAKVHFVSYEPALGPIDPRQAFPQVPEWIICGGESGNGRRPFDEAWARTCRDVCTELGITFFYKQKGGRFPDAEAPTLDGKTHHAWPVVAQ